MGKKMHVYDVVIIGSGPAGQKAAIQSAKLGKAVAVIEKEHVVGGSCLNSGTIPSKSLREAIIDLGDFYERSFYANEVLTVEETKISINDLNFRLGRILQDEREIIARQFKKNKIDLLFGCAQFIAPHRLKVQGESETFEVQASTIIIATGSKPCNPIHVPFDNEFVLDSTRLLQMGKIPKTMIVLGAGIVGTEYASFFSVLGTKVSLVDKRERLMGWMDREISEHLIDSLKQMSLNFKACCRPIKIWKEDSMAHVQLDNGEKLSAEVVLYALGRTACVDSLKLDNAGLSVNEKGFISVNALFQTSQPHIYAVGDVIGPPALASTSMEQGRLAARNAVGVQNNTFSGVYPIGIYTIPEISSVGYTEEELNALDFRYEVGRAYYYELARSRICGGRTGLFKILFNPETLQILGIHIIGRGATEVIHIGQVAMSFRAPLDYFIDHVFNYPTYAEGYRVAAFNGLNKISHRK